MFPASAIFSAVFKIMADNKLTCFFCDKEIITLDKFKLDCNKEVSPTKEPVEMGKIGNKPICSLCFGNIYGMIMLLLFRRLVMCTQNKYQ